MQVDDVKYDSCIHIEGVGPILTPLFPQWGPDLEWSILADIKYVAPRLLSLMDEVAKYNVFTLSKSVTAEYVSNVICQVFTINTKLDSYQWLIGFDTIEDSIIYHLTKT